MPPIRGTRSQITRSPSAITRSPGYPPISALRGPETRSHSSGSRSPAAASIAPAIAFQAVSSVTPARHGRARRRLSGVADRDRPAQRRQLVGRLDGPQAAQRGADVVRARAARAAAAIDSACASIATRPRSPRPASSRDLVRGLVERRGAEAVVRQGGGALRIDARSLVGRAQQRHAAGRRRPRSPGRRRGPAPTARRRRTPSASRRRTGRRSRGRRRQPASSARSAFAFTLASMVTVRVVSSDAPAATLERVAAGGRVRQRPCATHGSMPSA